MDLWSFEDDTHGICVPQSRPEIANKSHRLYHTLKRLPPPLKIA